tara:strand:+ start:1117 stop:2886 length:1770 start_codon:yes stop_codon:yes gene_type:complete
MARQAINIGSSANDGTGDPLRTAFDKINDNFVELYGTDNDINTLDANLNVNTFAITTGVTNGDITVTPNGTGSIKLGAMKFVGTTMSSDDSTQITIAENIETTGTLSVAGALSSSTSLALATGATVTGIADEDNMSSDSATLLATQQSIKAYVDTQITAEDLDITADDSTALSIDLDSDTLHFAGGTGITTSVSGKTVSHAIDSTVATLTGSQTLTNKVLTAPTINGATMTGNVTVDNLIFNDTDISTASDGNLTLNPGGSGTIELHANTNVTGTITVSGTTNTADVATTGNTTISGSLTTGTFAVGDLNIIADGTITSDTNGDIAIDPAGTGAIVLTGPITHTGTQTTTGQLNVDNLRLDGNVLSSTSGAITLTPANDQNVTVSGTNVKLTASESNFTLMEATTVRTDFISSDTSNADIDITTQGTGVVKLEDQTQLTLTGSFLPAIHTFTGTDAVTIAEHAGRTLLLGEVGGNALVTLTLPAATGSGATYKFIVSVANTSNYVIKVADASDTIDGIMLYLDEDGTAVSAFPTVATSDTITLNGGTTGGIIGDYLELVDIATDQYHVRGTMRVASGADPATPFSATVS